MTVAKDNTWSVYHQSYSYLYLALQFHRNFHAFWVMVNTLQTCLPKCVEAISNHNKYVIKDAIKLIIKCKTTIIKRFVHKVKEYKQHSSD